MAAGAAQVGVGERDRGRCGFSVKPNSRLATRSSWRMLSPVAKPSAPADAACPNLPARLAARTAVHLPGTPHAAVPASQAPGRRLQRGLTVVQDCINSMLLLPATSRLSGMPATPSGTVKAGQQQQQPAGGTQCFHAVESSASMQAGAHKCMPPRGAAPWVPAPCSCRAEQGRAR